MQCRVALVIPQLGVRSAAQQRTDHTGAVALGGQVQWAAAVVTQLGLVELWGWGAAVRMIFEDQDEDKPVQMVKSVGEMFGDLPPAVGPEIDSTELHSHLVARPSGGQLNPEDLRPVSFQWMDRMDVFTSDHCLPSNSIHVFGKNDLPTYLSMNQDCG